MFSFHSARRAIMLVVLVFTAIAFTTDAVPVQLYGLNYNTRKGADWNPTDLKCKTYLEAKTDLTVLSRITNRIRILSLYDCGQGQLVLQIAKELGLTVWLGLWVSDDPDIFQREYDLLEDMLSRGLIDDTVDGISVGSESIYREEVTEDEIIILKDQVSDLLANNSKSSLLVSICDIAPTYQYKTRLVSNVDIVVVNSFPFWEAVDIDGAMDYLLEEINPIASRAASEGKDLIMGETGWPSDGFISGVGVASSENQQQFFVDFYCQMDRELGWKYYYFTGIDNAWRREQDPNNTIEGNWGFMYADLELKPWFQNLTFTCPQDQSTVYSFTEIDWTVPLLTAPPTISPAPTPPLSEEQCLAHKECKEVMLTEGNCCPTDEGVMLGCCGDLSGVGDSTTTSPLVDGSTTMPTVSPTEAPVDSATPSPTVSPTATPTATDVTASETPEPTASPVSSSTTSFPTEEPTIIPPTLTGSTPMPTPTLEDAPFVGFGTSNGVARRGGMGILSVGLCSVLLVLL